MADVYTALVALCRLWVAHPEEIKVPSRSQTLASWALPMLSKSIEAEEKERAALEMFRSVQSLAAKQTCQPTNQPTN